MKEKIYCKCCNTQTKYVIDLFPRYHLKKVHNLTLKEYYDLYFKKENEGICTVCSNETTFLSFKFGYSINCSSECMWKNSDFLIKQKESLQNYDRNISKNKRKNTCIEKYGVDCISKNNEIKDKIKQNCLEKYGVSSTLKLEKCKNKRDEIMSEKSEEINAKRKLWWKTGNNSLNVTNNRKQAVLEKYQVDNVLKLDSIKKDIILTNFKKYGTNYYCESSQHRKVMEEYYKWMPLELKTEFELYYREVYKETFKYRKVIYDNWNGVCYYTNIELKTFGRAYDWNHTSIDHKISIYNGYINNIDPKIIGSLDNLCICARVVNILKGRLTAEEFLNGDIIKRAMEIINEKRTI